MSGVLTGSSGISEARHGVMIVGRWLRCRIESQRADLSGYLATRQSNRLALLVITVTS